MNEEKGEGMETIYFYNRNGHKLHIKGYCRTYDPAKTESSNWVEVESEEFAKKMSHQKCTMCQVCQRRLERELRKSLRKETGK